MEFDPLSNIKSTYFKIFAENKILQKNSLKKRESRSKHLEQKNAYLVGCYVYSLIE